MNLFHSIILGIVEGVTEFLPISSTAHLIITSKFLNIGQTDFLKFFEVFIQSGAILAVIILYYKDLVKNKKLQKKVLFSFIPTAVIGFLLYKIIKKVFFDSNILIILSILIIGILFLLIEYLIKNKKIKLTKSIDKLNIKEAIIIGLAQSIAVIPGVSRAGITMFSMMLMGWVIETGFSKGVI